MYTTENLVFTGTACFFGYPILKFLLLAIIEKINNDMMSELDHLDLNTDLDDETK